MRKNRERIYIVGFRDRKVYERFYFPRSIPLTTKLSDCINMVEPVEENFYYRRGTCRFYDTLALGVQHCNTLYQWRRHYVRQNRRGLCPTLTANMGTGGHNVPIVKTKFGIRKLTPRECFNFMGYPKDFDFHLSINEEDSYRFSDSRSLMSKLPRRVSASAGLPKGVQLGFCTFSKRSFTCLDTTVYSFRSHISPQTSLRDSPPLDLKR